MGAATRAGDRSDFRRAGGAGAGLQNPQAGRTGIGIYRAAGCAESRGRRPAGTALGQGDVLCLTQKPKGMD